MKKILSLILVAIMLVTAMPMAFAEGDTYKVGDIVQFGSYPQSKVTDETLIEELDALAPEWDDWTSYGYYTGTGDYGTMVQGDWMRYTDIMYNGSKYRGVKFTQYRPYWTCGTSSDSVQDDNGYSTNTVYWFKFEPIDWRVLDPATGLVMCETIIDSQPYSNTLYYKSGASDSRYAGFNFPYTNYASDYETSSIRKWLNNDFYNTAFKDSEKKEINTTTLNNDGCFTSNGVTGYEKLDSNSTNDKIFLLSYNEVRNSNFGFNSSDPDSDPARFAQGSDYAQSQGLYVEKSSDSTLNNNSCWILRSPGNHSSTCCSVAYYGNSNGTAAVWTSDVGVRPALRVNLSSEIVTPKHTCSYRSVVTKQPTHLELGEMTYTCDCGDTYTESIPKLTEHTYTSSVTTQPTHLKEGVRTYICECNDTYIESIPKLEEHNHIPTVTAPTCTSQGFTTFTCECGDIYVANYVEKLPHSYIGVTIPPTCTDKGYNLYTCSCGDSYINNYVKEKGHIDINGDYKCDYNCGYEIPKPEPEKERNFFEKIIEWLKNLFDKLFGWMK